MRHTRGDWNNTLDTLLFLGLLAWTAIGYSINPADGESRWYRYGIAFAILVLSQLPVLLFNWYKADLQQNLPVKKFRLYWWLCFGVYLGLLMLIATFIFKPGTALQELVLIGSFCSLALECVLIAAAYSRQRSGTRWVQKLSLSKAILISITVISILLGLMAASSWNNPRYHFPDRLLLGADFNIRRIIAHFDVFLSYTAQFFFMYACGYLFFWLNNKWLVPKVLRQRGILVYIFSVVAIVALLYPLVGQLLNYLPANKALGGVFASNAFATENAMSAAAIMLISLPLVLAMLWGRQNSQLLSLEKEKTQTELDLLKQQLNPHFFFNTLNNLYALSLQQSKQTPESILQLSELMRYVIYKAKEPQVQLTEEVKYIEDYIQLQQIRLKQKPLIEFVKEIREPVPPVAPLLLIVLIENAFKHGIEPAEDSAYVKAFLQADARQLYFSCENSFEPVSGQKPGIGLVNLERRLALLYPGKHVLKTEMENCIFKAELQLDLT